MGIHVLLTGIYAFSPMVLGLVNYNYWDYWTIVIWPIILYTAINKKWIYHFALVIVFIFTKETAIIAYSFWCLGMVCFDCRWKKNLKEGLKQICKDKIYITMILTGAFWLCMWFGLPHWNGSGKFIFDISYIVKKLQVFYLLNFNWLLTVLAVAAVIQLQRKRYKDLQYFIYPIIISDIAVVAFNCLFRTVNHPRYMDSHIFVLCFMAALGIKLTFEGITSFVLSFFLSVILFIANYITYDVISLNIFPTIDVGEKILDVAGDGLSDSIVYNQQYRYLDKAINLALEDAVKDSGTVYYFPLVGNNPWYLEGISAHFTVTTEPITMSEFWDQKRKQRAYYATDDCIPLDIVQLPDTGISEEIFSEHGYYFYFPSFGKRLGTEIELSNHSIQQKEFHYRGIIVYRLKW